ncbi:serine/threonine-protein phosphatase [candidate division KSB1 bacterium]|nr:serine/threonine-protein phosphatase [candidate division KSB1 bacterium]
MTTKVEEGKKAILRIRRLRKNPWLLRPRRERLGFALAAFCLFAPIGILNQLLRLPATPRPLGFALLFLLLSGIFAAYMVFTFDRAVWVIVGSIAFFLLTVALAKWESSWRMRHAVQTESQSQSPAQIVAQNAIRQYRESMNHVLARDIIITIGMIVLGYIFFVRAFGREMEKRTTMESELKVAHRIQESLLPPRERKMDGWHLFGTVRPASTVAGDYFDYIELPNGRLGVLVADASGHGVAAGLLMAMLKSQLLNLAAGDEDPQALFQRLNRSVRRLAPKHTFVTAAFVILPTTNFTVSRQNQVEIVTVGHPPVLLHRAATKAVEEIRTPAPALGLNENLAVDSVKCVAEIGDLLLLYTDGLFEQFNAKSTEWGLENLKVVLLKHAPLSPPQLCEAVFQDGATHRGNQPQHDDITLVAIRHDRTLAV